MGRRSIILVACFVVISALTEDDAAALERMLEEHCLGVDLTSPKSMICEQVTQMSLLRSSQPSRQLASTGDQPGPLGNSSNSTPTISPTPAPTLAPGEGVKTFGQLQSEVASAPPNAWKRIKIDSNIEFSNQVEVTDKWIECYATSPVVLNSTSLTRHFKVGKLSAIGANNMKKNSKLRLIGPITLRDGKVGKNDQRSSGSILVGDGSELYTNGVTFTQNSGTYGGAVGGERLDPVDFNEADPNFKRDPNTTYVHLVNTIIGSPAPFDLSVCANESTASTCRTGGNIGNSGGGLYAKSGWVLDLENTIIRANQGQYGGGIHATNGARVNINTGTVIEGNRAFTGGGMYATSSDVDTSTAITMKNATFRQNVDYKHGGGGCAFADLYENTQIDDSVFDDNRSPKSGAAINSDSCLGDIIIKHSNFTRNRHWARFSPEDPSSDVGAIYATGATFYEISGCLFEDNGQSTTQEPDHEGTYYGSNGAAAKFIGVIAQINNTVFRANKGSSVVQSTATLTLMNSHAYDHAEANSTFEQTGGFMGLDRVHCDNSVGANNAVHVKTARNGKAFTSAVNSSFASANVVSDISNFDSDNEIYMLDSKFSHGTTVVPADVFASCVMGDNNHAESSACGLGQKCKNDSTAVSGASSIHCFCDGYTYQDFAHRTTTPGGTVKIYNCLCPKNHGGVACKPCLWLQVAPKGVAGQTSCRLETGTLLVIILLCVSTVGGLVYLRRRQLEKANMRNRENREKVFNYHLKHLKSKDENLRDMTTMLPKVFPKSFSKREFIDLDKAWILEDKRDQLLEALLETVTWCLTNLDFGDKTDHKFESQSSLRSRINDSNNYKGKKDAWEYLWLHIFPLPIWEDQSIFDQLKARAKMQRKKVASDVLWPILKELRDEDAQQNEGKLFALKSRTMEDPDMEDWNKAVTKLVSSAFALRDDEKFCKCLDEDVLPQLLHSFAEEFFQDFVDQINKLLKGTLPNNAQRWVVNDKKNICIKDPARMKAKIKEHRAERVEAGTTRENPGMSFDKDQEGNWIPLVQQVIFDSLRCQVTATTAKVRGRTPCRSLLILSCLFYALHLFTCTTRTSLSPTRRSRSE
jgi:hypothetical protein